MRRRAFLALSAAALLVPGPARPAPVATLLGAYRWSLPDPHFGGFSAIEVWNGGRDFLAVSDRAYIVEGQFRRANTDGEIVAVEAGPLRRLRNRLGRPMQARRLTDAEGVARAPDGRLWISFEGEHRVWSYAHPDAPAEETGSHPDFAGLQVNSGLEALAIDARGTLYAVPERSGALERPFPVYRFRDGVWDRPFTLPRYPPYLPVGADFGPDGRFYLLERDFRVLGGFSSRIRRFTPGPEGFGDEETILVSRYGLHDNLEGLSVWRDRAGLLRLTMISDDNFRSFQRTEIVEYRLAAGG